MGKLQNEDFKTEAELTGAGGVKAQLLNDTKVYVTGNSINKTLDDAIIDGDIGGSTPVFNVTEWASYTPTFTGFGTVSAVAFYWRRTGDTCEIRGNFTSGVSTAVEAQVTIPSGLTIDTNINSTELVGFWRRGIASGSQGGTVLGSASDTFFNMSERGNTLDPLAPATGNNCLDSGHEGSYFLRVPIVGWDSFSPAVGGVPLPKYTFISGQETSGTHGGSASANTIQTRTLNTLTGDNSYATLLSNQVTLVAGTYVFRGYAPGRKCGRHQLFLYNTSDSVYVADDGISSAADSTDAVVTNAYVSGQFIISATKTFELRHWTSEAFATTGLGVASDNHASNPQTKEVYAKLELIKVA